ncbi:unnamed protein product [Lota lota]
MKAPGLRPTETRSVRDDLATAPVDINQGCRGAVVVGGGENGHRSGNAAMNAGPHDTARDRACGPADKGQRPGRLGGGTEGVRVDPVRQRTGTFCANGRRTPNPDRGNVELKSHSAELNSGSPLLKLCFMDFPDAQ